MENKIEEWPQESENLTCIKSGTQNQCKKAF